MSPIPSWVPKVKQSIFNGLYRNGFHDDDVQFITRERLKEIWKKVPNDELPDFLIEECLCILSTLVYTDWPHWRDIKQRFATSWDRVADEEEDELESRAETRATAVQVRTASVSSQPPAQRMKVFFTDKYLPFTEDEVLTKLPLVSVDLRKSFKNAQHIFNPVTIEEDAPLPILHMMHASHSSKRQA